MCLEAEKQKKMITMDLEKMPHWVRKDLYRSKRNASTGTTK